MKINVGAITGRRVMTFRVSADGKVPTAKFRNWPVDAFTICVLNDMGELIPARESFRRWKVARKAWKTRRGNTTQLQLELK